MEDEAELLARAAEGLEPARNTAEPSPLRRYMREHYDALVALKAARGLSWPQLAVVLSKRGLTKTDGSPLDGNAVAVMAAQVRWERDPASRQKRKKVRRKGKAAPAMAAVAAPVPAPTPEPQPVLPRAVERRPREIEAALVQPPAPPRAVERKRFEIEPVSEPPPPSPHAPEHPPEAEKVRRTLARVRGDIGEPPRVTLGAEARRQQTETDQDG